MSVKKWCKWPHHANGSSGAFLAVLNHILEPCWKLFVRNLVLSHVLSAKKAQNKGVIFFISFSLYTDHLNFFPACGCLHGFQTLTSSDQDVKIHGCSFGNYLWVVLACLVGIFPIFLLTLCLESPLLWRGFFAGADCCQSCLQSYRSLEALAVLSRLKNRHWNIAVARQGVFM